MSLISCPPRTLRAAVIGLGVGEQHLEGYLRHPACKPTVICDFDPDKLDEVRRRHPGLKWTSSADSVLEDPSIDVVSIATWDNHHFEQIERALLAGKHVFAEKPLCLEAAQLRRLRNLLDARPELYLSSNLILRTSPRFVELKRRIEAGEFGALYHLEGDYNYGRLHKITEGWRGRIPYYSVVHGGAVHLVDLLTWLSGGRIVEVVAWGNAIASAGSQYKFNDHVAALLKFEGGAVGKVTSNYGCVMPHFHGLSIYGTQAAFIHAPEGGRLYRSRDANASPELIAAPYPGVHKGALAEDFIDAIVNGRPPRVTAEEVFHTMAVCLAIEESCAAARPLEVN